MTGSAKIEDFRGDWALVTGASAGIGREFAEQLAAAGMNIVLVARREDRLAELAALLGARHAVRTLSVPIDLSTLDAADLILERLRATDIHVRVLCNNAAFGHWGHFDARDAAFYQRMTIVNVVTMTSLCRALLPDLRRFATSVVINVSSGAAFQPVPYMAVYGATKAFASSFSLALHEELAATGTLVQTLIPGPTSTEFDQKAGAPSTALHGRTEARDVVADSLRHLRAGIPLALHAKGTYGQRFFNGLFPVRMVLAKVGKMFRPPG